jgi:hypothetical protein
MPTHRCGVVDLKPVVVEKFKPRVYAFEHTGEGRLKGELSRRINVTLSKVLSCHGLLLYGRQHTPTNKQIQILMATTIM